MRHLSFPVVGFVLAWGCVGALPVLAQRGGHGGEHPGGEPAAQGGGNTNLNPAGTNGNILHPGVPATGAIGVVTTGSNAGMMVGPGPASTAIPIPGPGGFRSQGSHGGNGRVHGGFDAGGYGGGYAVPYSVGVYGVGYGNGGYGSGYTMVHNPPPGTYDPIFGVYNPELPQGALAYPVQQQQPAPVVVINQNFQPEVARPVIHDYTNVPLPERGAQAYPPAPSNTSAGDASNSSSSNDTPLILIAMKDHTIYPALAYWVQGDTLNYVMVGGSVNHVSISGVDRELSAKLNAERRPDFKLP